MALDLGRWVAYAQAKLKGAVSSADAELDQLEAERAAQVADKPWLASDGEAPSFDEARARIEWEAEEQRRRAEATSPSAPATPPATPEAPTTPRAPATTGSATPSAPAEVPEDPEVSAARAELARREQEGKARLDAIREELGVSPPPDPAAG